ncbi:replication protein A 70 kDa DNA-binding subunit B, partial [Tanacetum coccineum]
VENASNITMIKDVDPMLDNITVLGRCISLFCRILRIQVYVKKEWMFRFEPLFKEGQCYAISNFTITENSGKLPLLLHKYKIHFYKGTVVTRIDHFDENLNGFILEQFNSLLDGTHHYHEHEAVDVVPVQSTASRKIRRTVVIEDSESNQLDWIPSIHNALFGTKTFINRDLLVIFILYVPDSKNCLNTTIINSRYLCLPLKIQLSQSQNFFMGRSRRWSHRFVNVNRNPIASSTQRFTEYTKKMARPILHVKSVTKRLMLLKVNLLPLRAKKKVVFYCEDHGLVQVASRCDAVNDDPEFIKHFKDGFMQDEDSKDDFTTPANKIKVNNFTDDSLNRVLEMPPPSIEIGASGSGSVSGSKVNSFTDNSLNRVFKMRAPSTEMGASRSASGFGSKRVFIYLDEIDSEDEVEGCNSSNIPKIVRVKVEKEDP